MSMCKKIVFGLVTACVLSLFPVSGNCAPADCQLFVSVIQDPPVLSSRESINRLIDFAKRANVKVIFVQVYRANRSWFPCTLADPGPFLECRKSIGDDPLELFIDSAHAAGIQVHAWLNLLSLSANKDAPILKKYGVSILTRNKKKKRKLEDYLIDKQYFLEPGDTRVREELSGVVEELLLQYQKLDGIQFDYIRYPDSHPFYGYTEMNMARFRKANGGASIKESSPAWKDWKRRQVTEFLEMLAARCRRLKPGIQVSVTGCVPFSRAYLEAYQDWPSWVNSGSVDFVTVMSYSQQPSEFEKYIAEAKSKVNDSRKLNFAVGAYELAGLPQVFQEELRACEREECRGFVVLHYGSLLENPALADLLPNYSHSR